MDAEEPSFPLESLSKRLLSLVTEKMLFLDFIVFNSCSKFSSMTCDQLLTNVKLTMPVWKIIINDRDDGCVYFESSQHCVSIRSVPEHVRFECERLHISKRILEGIRRHNIRAKQLAVHSDLGVYSEFIDELLMLTRPEALSCGTADVATLALEGVQKLSSLIVNTSFLSEEVLLNIKAPILNIYNPAVLKQSWIVNFVKQWIRFEREIDYVSLEISSFDMDGFCEEFEGFWTLDSQQKSSFLLCRSENHSDCLIFSYFSEFFVIRNNDKVCPLKQ